MQNGMTLRSMLVGPSVANSDHAYIKWRSDVHSTLHHYISGLGDLLSSCYSIDLVAVLVDELQDILLQTQDCNDHVSLSCRQAIMLLSIYMEQEVSVYFMQLEPADTFTLYICSRVLPCVVPLFVDRCMTDPLQFVQLVVEMALLWGGEMRPTDERWDGLHATCIPPSAVDKSEQMLNAELPPPAGSRLT